MIFKGVGNLHELLVHLGLHGTQLFNGGRRADAGHHVLALGVHQKLAVELLFARGGIARKGYACAAVVAHVAKDHGLHIDGGAPVGRNIVFPAVDDGAGVVPAAEYGLDGFDELNLRVLGEGMVFFAQIQYFILLNDFFKILGCQLRIKKAPILTLDAVKDGVELGLVHLHDNVREHLDEPSVAVIGEALIVRKLCKALHGFIIQPKIQNRVHHAGHGCARAGTDGNEEGIGRVAELFASVGLGFFERRKNLLDDLLRDLLPVGIVARTRFGRNRKTKGNRKPEPRHFREVCALSAEQIAHGSVALIEQVNILVCQLFIPPDII